VPTPVHASLSVIVPAHNEAASIRATVESIVDTLHREHVDYEVLVVDDASTDDTAQIIRSLGTENPRVRYHLSHNPRGFGFTVRAGLDVFRGDVVAIVMASVGRPSRTTPASSCLSTGSSTGPSGSPFAVATTTRRMRSRRTGAR
jgi:Glycosyl transferase family 2